MPVQYLRILLVAKRLSVTNFSTLVDRIGACIRKWTAKSLSLAGRLELIRSEEGGLSIRHIQSWNVDLLARVLWNIHREADTLWVQWVNSVYLRGGSVWEWQSRKGDSPLLQRLVEIRNRLIMNFGSTQAAIQHMDEWFDCKELVTSKAYEYFRSKLIRLPWKATIWKAFIPPKYSFIMWLGLRGRLATRDRLAFLQEDPSCSLCINTNETAKHLFFKWLKKEKTGSFVRNKARLLALACTVYSLWRHRNEAIFEGKSPCPGGLVISIKITMYSCPCCLKFGGYFGCLVEIFWSISATPEVGEFCHFWAGNFLSGCCTACTFPSRLVHTALGLLTFPCGAEKSVHTAPDLLRLANLPLCLCKHHG
ncbi:hypothetical protein Salat_2154500 [Sesamum alatum]|uniref:Reverse transcriptase zinc-binding domain-containing protein n=1 Tax=Sesamum alatum TaxID=300844 RepID=A0AAE1Y2G0_9LAMI|nr:hypothetical protein Salat_2154500 [Sesamum alatum]